MSSTEPQYYVLGKFEGNFRTNQNAVLSPNDPFPKGDEHKVEIYRGIITQSESLDAENYHSKNGNFEIDQVNNVQINTSDKWPIKNDRIFKLTKVKLSNVEFSNVQNIDNKTYGEITADIVARVHQSNYVSDNSGDTFGDDHNFSGNQQNIYRYPEHDNTGTGNSGNGNGISDNSSNWSRMKGCVSWDLSWLRWLLYLLLLILLLYILSKCTKIGQKIYCEIADWRIENERQEVQEEIDTLNNKINATIQRNTPCGYSKEYSGGHTPYTEIRNLGNKSGKVTINFNSFDIPDRLEVIYDGKLVSVSNQNSFTPVNGDNFDYLIDLGFSQNQNVFYFNYNYQINKPTELLVRVIPNEKYPSTEWTLYISCPE